MATHASGAAPSWFRIVGWAAVVWNAFGVVMYLSSVGLFGDPLVDATAAERAAAESIPSYITAAFAIGTFSGLIGSFGLAWAKRWAWPMLLLSLVALVVLEGWIVFLSGAAEVFGLAIPATVTVIAAILALVAHWARSRGWLA
jgi:hypothetical protein